MSYEITALSLILDHYKNKTSIADFAKAIEEEIRKPALWPDEHRIRNFMRTFDDSERDLAWKILFQIQKFIREQQRGK
ncbi:hypothetical protein [Microcystis sp. M061S2]|uniref:hypothetical protein n=1 Tax=Microcystis sp. M061S2 TaxID=2771171 RepID=UPI00258AD1A4|nr:hypothetical protein [Microcystis sp. M061S2]MCA2654523.1 hypothetical protein [Microcystis sp. M061S2]